MPAASIATCNEQETAPQSRTVAPQSASALIREAGSPGTSISRLAATSSPDGSTSMMRRAVSRTGEMRPSLIGIAINILFPPPSVAASNMPIPHDQE